MPIIYHHNSKTFHLYNNQISYIFLILEDGTLAHLYYGKKVPDKDNYHYLLELASRPMSVSPTENLVDSKEHIKQEYSTYGHGDMRLPAFDATLSDGSYIFDFIYQSHDIKQGKPSLHPLPHTYVIDDSDANTLEITLQDKKSHCILILSYTIFKDLPVITRHVCAKNESLEPITLHSILSLSLDLPDHDYDMTSLTGAWGRERYVKEHPLSHGVQSIYSLRGHSSHHFNPFLSLKRKHTNEYSGEVLGFSLIYSGNFLAQVDVNTYDSARVTMGIHPHRFNWKLESGEAFQSPEVVMVYSDKGLNGMSQTFHSLYQNHLVRGKYQHQSRPILVNNWEGTYFDFNEEKILSMAKVAKELGIELFVLDDGWFGKRNDDTAGLGDWFVNKEKLPNGISGLSKEINDMGLLFGLWIEPEMVNFNSELYRNHPDWILQTPGHYPSIGRHQYILDFSNPQVITYIYHMMKEILDTSHISYIKWDMNRSMSEAYSTTHDADDQGKVMHQYILGVYRLYDLLTTNYPDILFESCASGGARFDPGMLYYAPQCWCSDDTDAIERIKIQYGTSYVYPISSIGSHVSAIPNHQLFRNTPLETRANVAYFGTFGYELDVCKLTETEKESIKAQINFMKQYRDIIQFGTFYRLISPFSSNETAWMVVSKDQNTALVGYYRVLQELNTHFRRISLQGLNPNTLYHVSLLEEDCYGEELMNIGLLTTDSSSSEYNQGNGDYISRIYILKAKKGCCK